MAKIKGAFCERVVAPKKAFDSRSFRWVKKGRNWLLVGCPRGAWKPRTERCAVGTRAYTVLARKRTSDARCRVGKTTLKGIYLPRPVKLAPYNGALGAAAGGDSVCAPPTGQRAITLCMKRTGRPSAPITGSAAVCAFLRGTANADREGFYTLHLDARGRVIGVEQVAKGTVNGVEVHPREVFKAAVLSNATAMIIAHNHPSGSATPSQDDIRLTKRLNVASRYMDIPIRDHVIVGGDECYSMRSGTETLTWDPEEQFRGARRR